MYKQRLLDEITQLITEQAKLKNEYERYKPIDANAWEYNLQRMEQINKELQTL